MGIFTGETTKLFFLNRGLGLQLKNKGFPQKEVLVTRHAFKFTRLSSA